MALRKPAGGCNFLSPVSPLPRGHRIPVRPQSPFSLPSFPLKLVKPLPLDVIPINPCLTLEHKLRIHVKVTDVYLPDNSAVAVPVHFHDPR